MIREEDTVKVSISYPDRRLTVLFAVLTLLFLYVLLKYAVEWAIVAVFVSFVLAFLTNMMPGSCTADDDGVTIKKVFGSQRIRYDDIQWVYTDVKKGSTSRGMSGMSVIYVINFVTSDGNFSCRCEHGRIPSSGVLHDTEYIKQLLGQSPFAALEKYVKERIVASVSLG